MFHLIQTDYNVDLYQPRRIRGLLRRRLGTKPKFWMDHRFKLFSKFTVPSLLAQTCQNWSWVIRIDGRTPKEDLEPIRKIVGDRASITTDDWTVVLDSICEELAVPLLTTRMDNDDMLRHTAIGRVQEEAARQNRRCIIDMPGGYSYDSDKRKLYFHNKFLDEGDVTHFSSLLELTPPFEGIHKYPRHKKLKGLFPVVNVDGRCWVEVCHAFNIKNFPAEFYGEVQFEELQEFW